MKVFDLFSGTGGYGLGLSKAGYDVVAFCECAPHAQRVLARNWPDVPIHPDITKLDRKWLVKNNITFRAMCGGFPCTDISIGGKGKGIEDGENSKLWKDYWKKIRDFRPEYAFIENVSALLHRGLDIVLNDLAKIGYDACWTTLDSQYSGVPQRRRRVYIVAVRDGIPAGVDIFRFADRRKEALRQEILHFEKSRRWNFKKGYKGEEGFAYFTRQRSDEFDTLGVASTLMKRDYKDFTDLILDSGGLRKLHPKERLLLQGYPEDYFDDTQLTNTEQYMLNGMTIPVVTWLGECVATFDRWHRKNKTYNVIDFTPKHWDAIDRAIGRVCKFKRDGCNLKVKIDGKVCSLVIHSCTLTEGKAKLNCSGAGHTFRLSLYPSAIKLLTKTLLRLKGEIHER